MAFARGLTAASLSLALFGAFALLHHTASVRAEDHPTIQAHLVVDGTSRTVTSQAARLSGLLTEAGVVVRPVDQVDPSLNTPTRDGMTARVNHARTEKALVRTVVPFQTRYQYSFRIPTGHRWTYQQGSPGIREDHLMLTTVGGRVVHRTLLNYWWNRRPKDRMIAVGVDPFSSSRSLPGMGRMFTMVASKYDVYLGGAGSGRTCTGIRAHRGIVAVDPRYIPLGTHLYVEGYGPCVAADTGGAIKGRRIDLCVESPHEANAYGIHRVRVFIVK